jgi:hypothetical protein
MIHFDQEKYEGMFVVQSQFGRWLDLCILIYIDQTKEN